MAIEPITEFHFDDNSHGFRPRSGGGWTIGSIDTDDGIARQLAVASDLTVLSVGYALAPEHPFPRAAEETVAAVGWAAAHASELGIDAAGVVLGGCSAGANLALGAAMALRGREGPAVRGAALFYGVFDCDLDTANAIYFPLVEETGLERRFGDDYRRYKANVPRWIPRLTPWTLP